MNTREQLNQYLRGLESRLKVLTWSRGVAIAFGVALGATLALVMITNAYAFSTESMVVARVVLFISLAVALGMGLVIPLLRLNERRAAGKAEEANPAFQQRLLTYMDRRDEGDPFIELLAEDTLKPARQAAPTTVVPQQSIFGFATGAGAAGAVLLWMIMFAPGYLGFGAKTLWAGLPKAGEAGFYQLKVEPGDETVRRRTDVSVIATLQGFTAQEVRLMAKYDSGAKWEEAIMAPRPGESTYGYLLPAVPEGLQYYVEAAGVKSKTFHIKVVDLPGIKNIKVTYHYPSWMHAADFVEDPGGDLRAVVGTVGELTVETDKPLTDGLIVMQDGTELKLVTTQGNFLSARVPIEKEGAYHFAAKVNGEVIRLTPDYFIEAQEDSGPKVTIKHPGADAQVNPLEEVIVQVEATDDFGVAKLQLHYSVNGEPEKVIDLAAKGTPQVNGQVTLYLEDFHMIPGDVVSLYATAKDARTEASSDIGFIQAMPFEKNYSQSQQGGGGGGGGGGGQQEEREISRRQRDIISMTFKATKGTAVEKAAATKERAEFLAEAQKTLKAQADSLVNRVKARELDGESGTIKEFVKEMEAAAADMSPATDKLAASSWEAALIPEKSALAHLQRAEQLNRDIQVAFGNQQGGGGGGGGGGQNAGRDLANLFDLELDTEKNQYEQAQGTKGGGGGGAEEQQEQVDDILKKLEELAKRQQAAANNQGKNKQQQTVDRRWEQESLRREAEELKKQLEQLQQQQQSQQGQQALSRGQQGKQGQQGQQGQSGQQGQQGQSGQQGQQGKQGQQSSAQAAQARELQQLLDRLKQATNAMGESNSAAAKGDQAQADAAAQRAAQSLKDAQQQGNQMQRQGVNSGLDQVARRAQQLAEEQHKIENQFKQLASKDGLPQAQRQALAAEKEQMLKDFQQLERDLNRQQQQLRQSDPEAAREIRDGLSEAQQNQTKERIEYGLQRVQRGTQAQIEDWAQRYEPPLTKGLDKLAEAVKDAQGKLGDGNKDGNAQGSQLERQVQDLESMRAQIERLQRQLAQGQGQQGKQGQGQQGQGQQGQGQQQANGQQQGQGKEGQGKEGQGKGQGQGQGKEGQQGQGGQQGGGQQGGNQQGGNQFGGGNNGGYAGGYDNRGRYNPEGIYDREGATPVDPRQIMRDAQRDIRAIQQGNRDNRDIANQAAALEREIQNLAVGNPSGPELEARLSRAILPQLESLEVQMRQELDKEKGGQVRNPATDKTPAGYATDVAEYYRKLGKSK